METVSKAEEKTSGITYILQSNYSNSERSISGQLQLSVEAQFQPAFNGVNTLLDVSTNEQITNGNLKLLLSNYYILYLKIQNNPLRFLE
jgi:queuine/archaeosine tRNA-ribosyltransferase